MHVSLHLHAPTDSHVGTVASSQNPNFSGSYRASSELKRWPPPGVNDEV